MLLIRAILDKSDSLSVKYSVFLLTEVETDAT